MRVGKRMQKMLVSRSVLHWLIFAMFSLVTMTGSASAAGALKQNFQQVDINTVIEAVAKLSGKNFIIDPRVKGKVTVIAPNGMNSSELYQTLLAVLNVHNYAAVPSGDVIKIVPANMARDRMPYLDREANRESWVTEVLEVNHVDAAKLVAILRPMVAQEGHLVAITDSNKLVISDIKANIERIKAILKRVDVNASGQFEVIKVTHTAAEELARTLQELVKTQKGHQEVKVAFDARTNRLILSGDESQRVLLRALIADLDVQVEAGGRVQVVYLRYAKAAEIAPVLKKIADNRALVESVGSDGKSNAPTTSDKSLKSQISIEADERMNALIISAPTAVVSALKNVIQKLDIRRAQVLIEAVFVEISQDKAVDLGVEWGVLGSTGVGAINFSGAIPALVGNAGDTLAQSKVLGRGITLGGGDINAKGEGWGALLRALNTDSASNILATPSLLTLDNEEAEIVVGREVPFQTGSYTSGTNSATNPFSTIERKNVGLKLTVKPQINEGNEIYLDIDQEVSDVLPKGEAVDIQTTKRQIRTRVIVGDGNVVVLGGLINEKETAVESKVPGLGDIPAIGALFRSTENSREKVNLMVFLRPVIIRDNVMSDYYSQKKYRHIYEEQEKLLDEKSTILLDGLRPKLMPFEKFQAIKPVVNSSSSQPVESGSVEEESSHLSNETRELLDL